MVGGVWTFRVLLGRWKRIPPGICMSYPLFIDAIKSRAEIQRGGRCMREYPSAIMCHANLS